MPRLAAGEVEWCELKEQWKDRKKQFLGQAEENAEFETKTK
jgi:hypothetical protein